MRLVALVGAKRSGKSEVAKILKWSGFSCIKFAQPLKDMILALPGITPDDVETNVKDEANPVFMGETVRHAMQTLGTEWGRNCIGENFWLSLWKRKIRGLLCVTVDDCRFGNEAQAVRDLGGVIWEVQRNGYVYEGHPSELAMSEIKTDSIILNNGSLYDLKLKVNTMLGAYTAKTDSKWEGGDIEPVPSRVIEGADA